MRLIHEYPNPIGLTGAQHLFPPWWGHAKLNSVMSTKSGATAGLCDVDI